MQSLLRCGRAISGSGLSGLALVGTARAAEVTPQGSSLDLEKVIWTISAIAVASLIMGILYLFKRRIGAFPRNPTWIAPISIMPSKDLPDESQEPTEIAPHGHAPAH